MLINNSKIKIDQESSMNYWSRKIREIDPDNVYSHELINEESSKLLRLTKLSKIIGLPIYDTFEFNIPKDSKYLINVCNTNISNNWKLSMRIMDSSEERLLFRNVDINLVNIIAAIKSLNKYKTMKVIISPYKTAFISGTLLMRESNTLLEIVYGPHHWISKSPPPGQEIYRCWYYFPHTFVKYSTESIDIRIRLFRILKDIIDFIFNLKIKQISDFDKSVYAEFCWRNDIGYKFLDCSFSHVWTGIKNKSMKELL